MLPRSAKDQAAFYVCHHRARDASACLTPRLRAADVDAAAFEMFSVVSHDLEATRRHVVEQIDARAAETRSLADRAEREVADLAVQAERVESDYRRGALPAEDYAHLRATIAEERRAAVEEAARLATRVGEVEAMRANVDAEDESLPTRGAPGGDRAPDGRVGGPRRAPGGDGRRLRDGRPRAHPSGWFNLKPVFRQDVDELRTGLAFGVQKGSTSGVPE